MPLNTFERWWSRLNLNANAEMKVIAYKAWVAGMQDFIKAQEPVCFWETSKKASDHVSFDANLADRWKTTYNMVVKPLYALPVFLDPKISIDCIDD